MIFNIISFAKTRSRLGVLIQKIYKRLFEKQWTIPKDAYMEWLARNKTDFSQIAVELNKQLWEEAETFDAENNQHAATVLAEFGAILGGGGYSSLLYFLCRHLRSQIIVETGVAAGFSSRAFLTAIQKNGVGRLYSSDLPYFRLKNPEQYVGILVEPEKRAAWSLFIEGDAENLPKILEQVQQIDLFHYDSDKSYSGRKQAYELIKTKLSSNAICLFDDIQDNPFFHDLVSTGSFDNWHVLEFRGKFIGLIGSLAG